MTINDFQACSPVPGGSYGAVCDNFLRPNQKTLSQSEWEAVQAGWIAAGEAAEVMRSGALADLKREVEKLCSETACTDDESAASSSTSAGLNRMLAIAKKSRALAHHN